MKKTMVTLLAFSLFAAASPVLAADGVHGKNHDADCARECSLLLRDCGNEVDSIQERIKKLETMINEKGSSAYTKEELQILKRKLKEANETLRVLNKN